MKLVPVKSVPRVHGRAGQSSFNRVFPRNTQAQLVRSPGQAFRVDEILFTRRQVSNLAASARRRSFQINSMPAGDLGDDWPMFEDENPKEQRDRRVIFITFNPKLQQTGSNK